MAEDGDPAAGSAHGRGGGKGRARRAYVRYSPELAVRLCKRLARGELLYHIARSRGMPTPEAVAKWAREKPDFAEALLAARRAGGRPAGTRGAAVTYSNEVADEIFERLCEGESLTRIGRDPTMPSLSTIFNWRRRIAAFEETVQLGMRIRAEVLADDGAEKAWRPNPETGQVEREDTPGWRPPAGYGRLPG